MNDFKNDKRYIEAMESRDWHECDIISDEYKYSTLENQIADMKDLLEEIYNELDVCHYAKWLEKAKQFIKE